ncbi:MAG: PQQ-binding-like beta-propeller repeat protein [Verrucomicrobia bacterium]|nr:PQQ-binding-like beta-propeller repeat protein [Verrucomicrobiota bacterium]
MKRTVMALLGAAVATTCTMSLVSVAFGDDWPQWRGPTRDGVWHETGIMEKFPQPHIKLLWRTPISNGYSGPTVANGRVYVTDRLEAPGETERVLCLDARTGRILWLQEYACAYTGLGYPDGPRACVVIDDGRAYSLGSMGHLRCHDAATGELLWKKDPGQDYVIAKVTWGISAAPLVEKDLLIVQLGARPGGCIVALDKRSGEEKWRALDDKVSYSAPIIIERAGRRLLLCWTGENMTALDPATGTVFWKYPTPPVKMIINAPTPVVAEDRIFLACFYDGSYMLRMKQDPFSVEKIWRRLGTSEKDTDALHSTISTPLLEGNHIYGVDSYGQFRCLEAATGDRVWEDLTLVPGDRWANIHMVRNGDKVWMFNERGELIITRLSPTGVKVISRAKLIEPTKGQLGMRQGVCWSHPAYAGKCIFARNDNEIVCASLAAPSENNPALPTDQRKAD